MEKLYLLGKDISHSASPAMYNALFEDMGLPWHYALVDLPTKGEAEAFLQAHDWLAINITTPYKPLGLDVAHVKAASVQLSGGANFLFTKQDQLVALNTDGLGCVRYIQHQGFSFEGARVVVCGTGPTALAIYAAAAQAGAGRLALIGRDRDHSKCVLERFLARYKELAYATLDLEPPESFGRSFREAYAEPTFVFGSYATSTEEIACADLLIDATPLGMNADDPMVVPAQLLGGQRLVFDVVYGHGESKLLSAAQEAGSAVLNGQGMVVAQAVENAIMLLNVHDVKNAPSWEAMFALMANSAGLAC